MAKRPPDNSIAWLLDGDPAIRWQVKRDLLEESPLVVERERRKITREGWGARLLAKQAPDGRWASGKGSDSGLYGPKWISTTYTMLQLRDFGLAPSHRGARKACRQLLDNGIREDGGINYGMWADWLKKGETCVTGMVLSLLAYFRYEDERVDAVVRNLLDCRMADGGWNCRRHDGATHSSMNTTISVLEGLRNYELGGGKRGAAVRKAQQQGREFLLVHRLFRSHRTGSIIKPIFMKFSFPPRWHYDVLRGLDYFREVNAPRDPRLTDAIEHVRNMRGKDGRWVLDNVYRGKTYFQLEPLGKPSRWNTLRALRVLKWWEGK